MRKVILTLGMVVLAGLLQAQPLRVEEAFVLTNMLATKPQANAPLYVHLANPTSTSVVITGATSPKSRHVVLRYHTKRDGQNVIESGGTITIPQKSRVKLLPDATELVLQDLLSPLQEGEDIPVILQLGTGQTQAIRVNVRHANTSPNL